MLIEQGGHLPVATRPKLHKRGPGVNAGGSTEANKNSLLTEANEENKAEEAMN